MGYAIKTPINEKDLKACCEELALELLKARQVNLDAMSRTNSPETIFNKHNIKFDRNNRMIY